VSTIHPSAVIHPDAQVGEAVTVGPFCVIEEKTVIGDGCTLGAHAMVRAYTRLGAGNRLFPYACVGGEPQDLKFHGEETWLNVGQDNTFREFCTIHRGTENGGGETRIGSGGLYMAYVHVAHDCILGDGVIMSLGASLAGHVLVGDRAIVGGMSGVHQFARIGEHAFVGARSGVAQDVPPFCLASGERVAMFGLNSVGLTRAGFSKEAILALKRAYKTLFRSGLDRQAALAQVEAEFAAVPEVMRLAAFVRASERGIVPAGRGESED
jgi:UDP-N-acetylglucosamine acyltransferase